MKNVAEKDENVTPKQFTGIQVWIATGDLTQAAKAAGVAPKTFHSWRRQPAFQAALRRAESEALASFSATLVALANETAGALRDGLSAAEPTSTRLRAASIVLDALLKVRELVTLEERVAALESKQHDTSQTT